MYSASVVFLHIQHRQETELQNPEFYLQVVADFQKTVSLHSWTVPSPKLLFKTCFWQFLILKSWKKNRLVWKCSTVREFLVSEVHFFELFRVFASTKRRGVKQVTSQPVFSWVNNPISSKNPAFGKKCDPPHHFQIISSSSYFQK